eukprot:12913276-Heterocapsa_arctica.AAC.1
MPSRASGRTAAFREHPSVPERSPTHAPWWHTFGRPPGGPCSSCLISPPSGASARVGPPLASLGRQVPRVRSGLTRAPAPPN